MLCFPPAETQLVYSHAVFIVIRLAAIDLCVQAGVVERDYKYTSPISWTYNCDQGACC